MDLLKLKENKEFYKLILAIAVPFMLQQLITSSVNLLDNLMVGQLGDANIAGVAAANRFYFVAIFSIFGVNGAAAIFMAQFFGAKKKEGERYGNDRAKEKDSCRRCREIYIVR